MASESTTELEPGETFIVSETVSKGPGLVTVNPGSSSVRSGNPIDSYEIDIRTKIDGSIHSVAGSPVEDNSIEESTYVTSEANSEVVAELTNTGDSTGVVSVRVEEGDVDRYSGDGGSQGQQLLSTRVEEVKLSDGTSLTDPSANRRAKPERIETAKRSGPRDNAKAYISTPTVGLYGSTDYYTALVIQNYDIYDQGYALYRLSGIYTMSYSYPFAYGDLQFASVVETGVSITTTAPVSYSSQMTLTGGFDGIYLSVRRPSIRAEVNTGKLTQFRASFSLYPPTNSFFTTFYNESNALTFEYQGDISAGEEVSVRQDSAPQLGVEPAVFHSHSIARRDSRKKLAFPAKSGSQMTVGVNVTVEAASTPVSIESLTAEVTASYGFLSSPAGTFYSF